MDGTFNLSIDLTCQDELMTVGECDGANTAIAGRVSVEEIQIECPPNGYHASFPAGYQVLAVTRRRHAQNVIFVSTVPVVEERNGYIK